MSLVLQVSPNTFSSSSSAVPGKVLLDVSRGAWSPRTRFFCIRVSLDTKASADLIGYILERDVRCVTSVGSKVFVDRSDET